MKTIVTVSVLVFVCIQSSAQYTFNGIRTSRRAGILGATINPADLSSMPQKIDVHIIGADVNFANNTVDIGLSGLGKLDSFKDYFLNKVTPEGLTARLNVDIIGPSGAYAINDRMTIGLITRGRIQVAVNNLDVALGKALANSEITDFINLPYTTPSVNNMSMNLVGWGEIGGTFAMKFYESSQHSIAGGATFKTLFSGGYANAFVSNFSATIDTIAGGNIRVYNGSGNLGIEYSGSNDPLESLLSNISGSPNGIGIDIGATYEYKDKKTGDCLLKLGASIIDIGSMTFSMNAKNSRSFVINPMTNIDPRSIQGANLDEIIANIKNTGVATEVPTDSTQTIGLPTAFNFLADWHVWKPLYLTFHMQRSLTDKDNPRSLQAPNFFCFTPRVAYRVIEAYMPLSISSLQGFSVGLGIKLGPIYFGTNSLVSALLSENNKAVDYHLGIRAGIGSRKKKN